MMRNIVWGFLFCLLAWIAGFGYYVYYINAYKISTASTDAIAVYAAGGNRLNTAISLLKKSYAPVLFITGVESAGQLSNFLRENKVSPEQIIYGYNTTEIEEAVNKTVEFINTNHIKSVRIVASSYNMPLVTYLLSSKAPYATVIIPHPVLSGNPDYLKIFEEYNIYLIRTIQNSI